MSINREVERFLRSANMPPTKFGRLVAGDPRLVLDMRNGREWRKSMRDRAKAFIAGYNAGQECNSRE